MDYLIRGLIILFGVGAAITFICSCAYIYLATKADPYEL